MLAKKDLSRLLKQADTLHPGMKISEVAERILVLSNQRFLSLAVVDGANRPLGTVSRYRLQDIFLQRYGRELWGRRPVTDVMNSSPLLIPLSLSIEAAAASVTAHVQYPVTEDFIFIDEHGQYQGLGIVLDLLDAMSKDLAQNRRALLRAQQIAGLASWEWNAQDDSLLWSHQLNRILQVEHALSEAPLASLVKVFDAESQARLRTFFSANYEAVPQTLELRTNVEGGEQRLIEFQGEHFLDPETRDHRAVGTIRDITERRLTEERLAHLANYDHLTRLPNRYLFQDRLQHAISHANRSGQSVALLFLDLDRFKWINDALGHAAGDELLIQVAQRLTGLLRSSDTVARLGGDEFTIILEDITDTHQIIHVVEQLLKGFDDKFSLGARDVSVSTSLGIALYPGDAKNVDSLLKSADAAMYRAKEHGRNGYSFYTEELNRQADRRFQLEHGLRRALERGEFELYFQPQLHTESGRLSSAEALLRWFPEGEEVSPVEFIPLLEDLRLIVPVGRWVLQQACAAAASWQVNGLPGVRVAVNLSVHQLRQNDFVATVKDTLKWTGLAPELLEIEVTESVLVDDRGSAAALLELNDFGVRVAIDDFGTGYSSLAYLKRFDVDTLKLDRTFVSDLTLDEDDDAIASAVIRLAHTLGITVTAEGVETACQKDFLRERSCDHIQGFLISRPVPQDEFLHWAATVAKLADGPACPEPITA
ncbi:bifunctional diguanylate cyclase/phosphodiesterase [Pseudomonas sp. OIL-1]|uniref:putative bifunctional diguanylate cyclase/phosphodiesterase n=1 Tax=Pseudomonas sp. OIL-1 TaxID=2706126 RepID=UPI0013A73CAB|nr:EAL domain-containing protein [Pseudomonas sp. OIL-1]QIB49980.1 EAL domain-containing protein [Pseudomonas sp. OIL-1]